MNICFVNFRLVKLKASNFAVAFAFSLWAFCACIAQAAGAQTVHASPAETACAQDVAALLYARAQLRQGLAQGDAEAVNRYLLYSVDAARRQEELDFHAQAEMRARRAGVRLLDEKARVLTCKRYGQLLVAHIEYERTYKHPLHGSRPVEITRRRWAVRVDVPSGRTGTWRFPLAGCMTLEQLLKAPSVYLPELEAGRTPS